MAISIDVDVLRTQVGGAYQQDWSVTAATDIPEEIFLTSVADGSLVRVCALADFVFPVAPDGVNVYYRASVAVLSYTSVGEAQAAESRVGVDIQALVDEYQTGADAWTGTASSTYTPTP